ncbi:hypothetical protein V1Y59_12430 [Gordonia sp. PKS22-38]|uniref:Uncharacterized protein n=1 Tax=Gordonia prachuapensis TaxID=3115651 RepID=A0ABU7MU78_9ACTN|nr:hypothetical protein [Gordonia sp. PKS22-38]
MNIKRIIAGALIGGAAVMGISLGAGNAEAKIEPGQYKSQYLIYGFIPTPESNVRVIGNRMYQDYYGIGPWNLSSLQIMPTERGGIVSNSDHPAVVWLGHHEMNKSRNGYWGTTYSYGKIPFGNAMLKKVR